MSAARDTAFLAAWVDTLAGYAEGLDFEDAEDRATFRMNVAHGTANLRCSGIRELVTYYTREKAPTSRGGAVRALANGFMATRRAVDAARSER